ncbi:transposase [Streptomyces sp. NBC_01485]|uniref:transposase n=1 Tax=Streptomyces sp. NBC_01485 TaxID=2903884 RepID=UPI003FCD8731
MDSQSVRASELSGMHGYDCGKKVSGIERHLLVDTGGSVLVTCVSPAGIGDHDGAVVLFARVADTFPRLRHMWADQGWGHTAGGGAPVRCGQASQTPSSRRRGPSTRC